ncbi:MAG: ATP-binding cassette domain-containing protein, partial [Phascolarctobacterium sp.]|nr:ATP-binding cassette domain-containing protein [Phascolarctobacterium sp.]
MISIKGLKHYYTDADGKEVKALDGIDLDIKKGEFVAIIGANGSGKSTLARHLNALLLPTAGTCTVGGLDTNNEDNMWDIRQQVGMVFQNPDNQIVAAIVEEDVAFGPENIGV